MQHRFIKTTNYIDCLEAMKELEKLPRDMEKMGLFYGNAGRGKTLIIEKIAIDEGAALVRTLGSWTPKQMMIDICEALELMDTGTTATLQHRIIDELTMNKRILIIDEVDTLFMNGKKQLLLMIRDIHDLAKTPIILTGMEQCDKMFKRDTHYYERFSRKVKMGDTTKHDIKQLCLNSDVEIEDDLVEHFFNKYGNFRPVKVLINALEEYCENNDLQSASLNTFKSSGVEKINAK
ncbi:ATP-binding protein [Aliarcobacter vitoriensis]|uniref:DNA transposition protein n=1 Tax=Aliarcobacter vitoriensis TaxID=2011099 RepID=A0A366MQ43_9BACT|nr:ATP-binding protein [Aliarcobacter vitoriensis]RBQ28386.1 DNA transposition protein [Aliarcobacter vitoriensis]